MCERQGKEQLETKKLEAFLRSIELSSINKAACEQGYTQSGLSYTLNTLEDELGIRLLKRSYAGISLTPEGRAVYPFIERIVQDEKELMNRIELIKNNLSESVRIGTYSSLVIGWLSDIVDKFKKKFPNISIEIVTGFTTLKESMLHEIVDIAVCEKHIIGNGYKWSKLNFMDEICVAVNCALPIVKQSAVSFAELKPYHVYFPAINEKSTVVLAMKKAGIQYDDMTNLYTDDGSLALLMVGKTPSVSFVSKQHEAECPQNVRLLPLNPKLNREIGIAVNEWKQNEKPIREFYKFMKNYIAV